jgi:hypothetical protein
MILLTAFFILQAFSQDTSLEEFCFSSSLQAMKVLARTKAILIPSDQVSSTGNCFSVTSTSHRRELIQGYVRRIDPSASIHFSSAEVHREHCQIKVEKIKQQSQKSMGLEVARNLEIEATEGSGGGREIFQIKTLKEFELSYLQDTIKGECRYITPQRYEISLEVTKVSKPFLPPVPPGTVVVVAGATLPEPQETARLQTQVQIVRGQRLEIGSIVKKMIIDSKKGEITPEVQVQHGINQIEEKVFLSIE